MDENKTFEDARLSAEEMFAQTDGPVDALVEEPVAEPTEQPVEEPTQETVAQQTGMTEQAISAAEQATAVAQQKANEVSELTRLLEAERQRNAELEGRMNEMNQVREEEIVEEALVPPTIDLASLAFEDPEIQAEAQRKYSEDFANYQRKVMEKEYQPFIERAKKMEQLEQLETLKRTLSSDARFEGFADRIPQLENIIERNSNLKNADMPYEDKLIQAYAIARGVDAMETPKAEPHQTTTDEFVEMYKNNPDFKAAIESLRIAELKDSQQVPPLSASSGLGNVAPNIKDKPKTFGEARDRAFARFGN